MDAPSRLFEGRRVLLVEDNFLVGTSIRSTLEGLGFTVAGPYATAAEAIASLQAAGADCGVLDINIRSGTSEPVARALEERGVPYIFVTGYRSPIMLAEQFRAIVRLAKPVESKPLETALASIMP